MGIMPDPGNGSSTETLRLALLVCVAIIASSVRFMIIPRMDSLLAYMRSMFLGTVSCVSVFLWVYTPEFGITKSLITSGLAAAVADDVIRGTFVLLHTWRENPKSLLELFPWSKK